MRRNLPTIPATEYRERWNRIQELMDQRNLDLFFAYADDRATFGPAHARWLANFPVHFEVAGVFMAKGKDPILVSGPESEGYAKLVGSIADVRFLRSHPGQRVRRTDGGIHRHPGLRDPLGRIPGRGWLRHHRHRRPAPEPRRLFDHQVADDPTDELDERNRRHGRHRYRCA